MDILGIGPLELLFVLIIALIILGPKDMVKAGRTLGRLLRSIVTSQNWSVLQRTSQELRNLPNRLMREAGLEDINQNLPDSEEIRREIGVDEWKQDMDEIEKGMADWTTPPVSENSSAIDPENKDDEKLTTKSPNQSNQEQ